MDPGSNTVISAPSSDTKAETSGKNQYHASDTKQMEDSQMKQTEKIAAHHKSICDRAKIQELVDFASSRLAFHEMHLSPFTINHFVSEHFNLISMDGAPLTNMALCKDCKTVLVRFRNGTTNLKVHQQHHLKTSPKIKMTKPKNVQNELVNELAPPMEKKRKLAKKKILVSKGETSQAMSAASH